MTSGAGSAQVDLVADCGACSGLCCVALPLTAGADFPVDKPAAVPCSHLRDDDRCDIHASLIDLGWRGCTVFDCFGAGQRVTAAAGGAAWRRGSEAADDQFAALATMRALHEMLWYLREAARLARDDETGRVAERTREVEAAAAGVGSATVDIGALRGEVGPVLRDVSARVRRSARTQGIAAPRPSRRVRAGADLAGARLRGADLRAVDLRSACLIGADLRGADLRLADLLGADLRGADLRGADLGDALFLTRPQAAAARTDASTRLPPALRGAPRPGRRTDGD